MGHTARLLAITFALAVAVTGLTSTAEAAGCKGPLSGAKALRKNGEAVVYVRTYRKDHDRDFISKGDKGYYACARSTGKTFRFYADGCGDVACHSLVSVKLRDKYVVYKTKYEDPQCAPEEVMYSTRKLDAQTRKQRIIRGEGEGC